MKRIFLLFISIALLTACGADDAADAIRNIADDPNVGDKGLFSQSVTSVNDNTSFLGLWESTDIKVDTPEGGQLVITMRLDIRETKVTNTARCSHGGQTVYVTAVAPAKKVGDDLKILDSSANEIKVNGLNCSAEISKGTMRASEIQNGKMGDGDVIFSKIGN